MYVYMVEVEAASKKCLRWKCSRLADRGWLTAIEANVCFFQHRGRRRGRANVVQYREEHRDSFKAMLCGIVMLHDTTIRRCAAKCCGALFVGVLG